MQCVRVEHDDVARFQVERGRLVQLLTILDVAGAFEFERTVSRLMEMRSREYLAERRKMDNHSREA